MSPLKRGLTELGPVEIGLTQFGERKIGSIQRCIGEVGLAEVFSAQANAAKVRDCLARPPSPVELGDACRSTPQQLKSGDLIHGNLCAGRLENEVGLGAVTETDTM
jgi:hypothetical protein